MILKQFLISFFLLVLIINYNACTQFESEDTLAQQSGSSPEQEVEQPLPDMVEAPPLRQEAPVIATGDEKLRTIAVAYGPADRTIISCDSGQTWTANRFDAEGPAYDPEDPNKGIGHSDYSPEDLDYYDGYFYYTQGWFGPTRTKVSRSRDGIHWQYVTPVTEKYIDSWSLAITPNSIIGGDHSWRYISKDGDAWAKSAEINSVIKQRHNYVNYYAGATIDDDTVISTDNGRFDVGGIIAYSDDDGRSFQPANYPQQLKCGGANFAYKPGGVIVSGDGDVCYSTDGGRNWQSVTGLPSTENKVVAAILYFEGKFRAYIGYNSVDAVYESVDGIHWNSLSQRLTMDDRGTFMSRRQALSYDKENQSFISKIRDQLAISDDGIHFQSVDIDEDQKGGHPVRFIRSGEVAVGPDHPCY